MVTVNPQHSLIAPCENDGHRMTTRIMAAGRFGRFGGSTYAITPPDDNSSSASRLAADGMGSLRRFGREALPARSAGCPILGGCAPDDNAPRIPGWPFRNDPSPNRMIRSRQDSLMVLTKRSARHSGS